MTFLEQQVVPAADWESQYLGLPNCFPLVSLSSAIVLDMDVEAITQLQNQPELERSKF